MISKTFLNGNYYFFLKRISTYWSNKTQKQNYKLKQKLLKYCPQVSKKLFKENTNIYKIDTINKSYQNISCSIKNLSNFLSYFYLRTKQKKRGYYIDGSMNICEFRTLIIISFVFFSPNFDEINKGLSHNE